MRCRRRRSSPYLDYGGRRGVSIVERGYKLIQPLGARFAPGRELYDRVADTAERRDLAAERPVLAGWLASLARAEMLHLGRGLPAAEATIDAVARRRLQALGYL